MKKNHILYVAILALAIPLVFTGCNMAAVSDASIKWGTNSFSVAGGVTAGSETVTATLSEDTFAAATAFTSATHPGYTVTGLPSGLTLTAARTSSTKVTFTLGGSASPALTTAATIGITFKDAAFTDNSAADVEDYESPDISIKIGPGGPSLNAVESTAFTSAVGDTKLTITLTGGTYAAAPLTLSQFSITTAGTGGFPTTLVPSTATVTRTSDTVVTITGLTATTAAGSGQKITVAGAAQATQATSVAVVAGTGT